MTSEEIFQQISDVLKAQLHNKDLEISRTSSLQDDLGIDSIALMEFIVTLEDEFGLDIPDEDIEDIHSMEEMTTYLLQRLNNKNA